MGVLDRLRLDGQVAIVTGAGRGVGEGIATVLAEAGATVICSARRQNEIDDTVAAIKAAGGKAVAIAADVMKKADLDALVEQTIERFGRIDAVINNAGGMNYRPFLEITEEEFIHHFNWNTTSCFLLSQAAAPHMLAAGRGAIVNISSGAAHFGIRGMMAYCVAKAATENLTRALAQELAPKIRVNALALGAIMTPSLQATYDMEPDFQEKLRALTPLHREGEAVDIGLAALYLLSDGCYASGAIFHIDGGLQDTNLPFKLPDL
ncbi:MAG: short-chain dehydrogenase/reductase [Bradyrhizobium sp.]|nr:short-chain dehydrogenase/reductase [Bradyrhizobium sp.]